MATVEAGALTIEPAPWCERAATFLESANQGASQADVRAQVDSGAARLFLLCEHGTPCGAFVLRIDQTGTGPQGVIVAAAGHRPGLDLIAAVLPTIEGMFLDVTSIRFHTRNPALARRLAAQGYAPTEIVSVKHL